MRGGGGREREREKREKGEKKRGKKGRNYTDLLCNVDPN
jgi:hypothetical protein